MDLRSRPKVLLVESDKESPQPHASVLMQKSYSVITVTRVSEALSMIINDNSFDCVLVDAQLHGLDLVNFLQVIWKHYPQLPIVAMTSSHAHMKLAVENLADHSIYVLKKPCDVSQVCNILQHMCQVSLTSSNNSSQQRQSMMECVDKGKQPMKVRTKRTRTGKLWTSALQAMFMEALAALGKKAYPTPILKHMNVPGLTRNQVASHLQKFQAKEKAALEAWQMDNKLQVESYAGKSFIQSTISDHHLNMTSTNSIGISHMSLSNIQARLFQRSPRLPSTQQTNSTIINSGINQQFVLPSAGNHFQPPITDNYMSNAFGLFDQANKDCFSKQFDPLTGATSVISSDQVMESQYCMEIGGNSFSNGFDNSDFLGAGSCAVSESLAPLASHDQGNGESSLDILDLILFDHENNDLFCDEFEQLTGSTTVTTDQVMESHVYSIETDVDAFYNTNSVAAGRLAGSEARIAQVVRLGIPISESRDQGSGDHQTLPGNREASLDVEEDTQVNSDDEPERPPGF